MVYCKKSCSHFPLAKWNKNYEKTFKFGAEKNGRFIFEDFLAFKENDDFANRFCVMVPYLQIRKCIFNDLGYHNRSRDICSFCPN